MPSWNSRGLRGSALEDIINLTNVRYREQKLALIQKIPTPITPTQFDKEKRHITLAFFEEKSTVDYIGAVQGLPVCFDAKECSTDTFALQNVHEHQINFMKDFERQGGIAFLLIYYVKKENFYYLPFKDLDFFWERMKAGGRKSFRFDELVEGQFIPYKGNGYLHYLERLAEDIERRES